MHSPTFPTATPRAGVVQTETTAGVATSEARWRQSMPEAEGVDPAGIWALIDYLEPDERLDPQALVVVRHGAVVVVTTSQTADAEDTMNGVWDYLLPAFRDGPLHSLQSERKYGSEDGSVTPAGWRAPVTSPTWQGCEYRSEGAVATLTTARSLGSSSCSSTHHTGRHCCSIRRSPPTLL